MLRVSCVGGFCLLVELQRWRICDQRDYPVQFLHLKLKIEDFLRTKGQAAGGAKELWSKLLSSKKKSKLLSAQKAQCSFALPAALPRVLVPPAVWATPDFEQTAVTVLRFSCGTSLRCPRHPSFSDKCQ